MMNDDLLTQLSRFDEKIVFISESSLHTSHPTYHRGGKEYSMMYGVLMECDPKHLNEHNCIEIPLRHAKKFAVPCLNCFRELRRK